MVEVMLVAMLKEWKNKKRCEYALLKEIQILEMASNETTATKTRITELPKELCHEVESWNPKWKKKSPSPSQPSVLITYID